jgi:Lipocalin-like domain
VNQEEVMTQLKVWRAVIAIALLCTAGTAVAQAPANELKDQLAGAWTLVSIHNVRADGTKYELFGPNAKGMLILDGSGHFALHVTRAGRPMFASENRMTGTAEENKAAVQGMISLVGSYTVNERDRSMLLRIDSSSYPNQDGTEQRQPFTIIGDQLGWPDAAPIAGPTGDLRSDLIWKRARK